MATRKTPKITQLSNSEAILEANQALRDQVQKRAYELSHQWDPEEKQRLDWLRAEAQVVIRPTMELLQTKSGWKVELALPGVAAGDVEIRVGDVILAVDAKRATKRNGEELVITEYQTDHAYREVSIPAEVDRARIKATLRDGVLAIDLPREKPAAAPRKPAAKNTSSKASVKKAEKRVTRKS